jgi:tripartite-type tricarboxylate transporter receptor subunit TctC
MTRNPRIRRRFLAALLAALPLAGVPQAATHAADAKWPSQPIRLIVPFAAGGPADALGRFIASKMAPKLGQPIIVEDRGGAGGTLGAAEVARATDGHTLLFSSTGALVIIPAVTSNLTYNPERDLVAIGEAVNTPQLIVVSAKSPYKTLPELIAAAKANPGKMNFASAGTGTTTQLGAELLKRAAGVDMTHIPYRGAGPAIVDVLSGTADLMVADVPAVASLVADGKLRALAIAASKRESTLPDVPTTAELGYPSVISGTWYGIMGPARLPKSTIDKVNAVLNEVLKDPDALKFFKAQGADPIGGTPQQFATFIKSEAEKWGKLAKDAGVRMD